MRISWNTTLIGQGASSRCASCLGPKVVVLGIMTSKTGELESADALKRRIDEATKYLPLEQLALSPQCGFASTEEGNTLSEDEQWRKLERCVAVARDVWGGV